MPVTESIEPFYLWPEHQAAFEHFLELATQWRVGMDGPTGLDYAGVDTYLRLSGVPDGDAPAVFQQLRALEAGAVAAFRELREKRSPQ